METARLLEEQKRVYWGRSRRAVQGKEAAGTVSQAEPQIKQMRRKEPDPTPERNRGNAAVNWGQLGETNWNAPVSWEMTAQKEGPPVPPDTSPDGTAEQVSREIQRQARRYGQDMEGWIYDEPSL